MRRTSRVQGFVCLLLFLGALAACGGGNDAPEQVAGNYRGTIQSSLGRGTATATIVQQDEELSGTWTTAFTNPTRSNGGSLLGTIRGNEITLTLHPAITNNCPANVNVTVAGTQISGSYAVFNCTTADSGTITMTRQ